MTRAWQNFRRHEAGVNFQRGRGRRQERLFLSDGLDFRGFLRSSAFFPPPHPPPATIKLRRVYGEIEVFLSFLLPCEIADSNSLIAPLRWRSMILPSPSFSKGCDGQHDSKVARVSLVLPPSFGWISPLRVIMGGDEFEAYASKQSERVFHRVRCWFLLPIRRSIVCCAGFV